MATSVALNIITGQTGTAHISSDDDAAIWRGLVGSDNVVLSADNQLGFTNNGKQGNDGSITIKKGVFCMKNGHMGRLDDDEDLTFSLPTTDGNYRRTVVIVRYAKTGDVESMALMTLQSDPQSDTSGEGGAYLASQLPVNIVAATDFLLYDFVCDDDGLVGGTLKTKLTVADTIPTLRSAIDTEESARINSISLLSASINSLASYRVKKLSESSGKYFTNNDLVLVIVRNNGGAASFIACRYGNIISGQMNPVLKYPIYDGKSCNVTFAENGSYLSLSSGTGVTDFSVLGVYEIRVFTPST